LVEGKKLINHNPEVRFRKLNLAPHGNEKIFGPYVVRSKRFQPPPLLVGPHETPIENDHGAAQRRKQHTHKNTALSLAFFLFASSRIVFLLPACVRVAARLACSSRLRS